MNNSTNDFMKNVLSWAFKCPKCKTVYYKPATSSNDLAEKYSLKNEEGYHEMSCAEAGGQCESR